MADESPLPFDTLVIYRQQLRDFCAHHYKSIIRFKDGISFKLDEGETLTGTPPHNLTSSATCIESLLDCPELLRPDTQSELLKLASQFSLAALKRPQNDWFSEKSARIYCRCRTLPFIVYHIPEYQDVLREHLEEILDQLTKDPNRLAVGETSVKDPKPEKWYPPNAFHTYWTLYLLHAIEERFPVDFASLKTEFAPGRFNIDRLRAEMLVWARHIAGYQVVLHAAKSPTLDSDQLAWSLAILAKFGRDFQANLPKQDFLRYALKCLFDHQNSSGIWRRGSPLFHYPESGNAYCYLFETFDVLLKATLTTRPEGPFLREVIYPYVSHLWRLWRYANLTKIQSPKDGSIFGWISGHRVIQTTPESWATASVFSYTQSLRKLVGIWCREAAASELRVSISHKTTDVAIADLLERGDTWADRNRTAATQLMTLFVNPIRSYEPDVQLDPDSQPIVDNQARGAILFGPPGTSKTTLCRALADAVRWDYVEIHASDFVAAGLPHVQTKADTIFKQLMQLDHTVILFDEIDELVRAREMEPDAFGRFLTTSMLPKLAQLWDRRKVVYFVATNHIRFFDPAVTRAQRFDALIQVSPPSFERKIRRISKLLKKSSIEVKRVEFDRQDVEDALTRVAKVKEKKTAEEQAPLPTKCLLAKFLLMRWDQLEELVAAIKKHNGEKTNVTLSRKVIEEALKDVSDPFLSVCRPFRDFVESRKYEQHDFSKLSYWEVKGTIPKELQSRVTRRNGRNWYSSESAFGDVDLGKGCAGATAGIIECG